ncbi:MAG: peptidase S8 and S53 subtilisin kexin sedolisin [Alcaligenaceae bacterium]|nr:MAG: peptidase S8 and S53 subtilisin kexin sedolisin [Alcaligenaceae bacterium]
MKAKYQSILFATLTFGSLMPAMAQQAWMSPEVGVAWAQGYLGQGVRINMIDDFGASCDRIYGHCHGAWTTWQAQSVAPLGLVITHEQGGGVVGLITMSLNVFNLSYGLYSPLASSASEVALVGYAQSGRAVVVKSAGNNGIPVGAAVPSGEYRGRIDNLAVSLAGQPSAILVGALSKNGTTATPASMASYSNVAGTSPVVQRNFLVVGVDISALGGLAGTSFAAPIVSGYAAIVGSKFTTANAAAVANQLLNTARTDTVSGYNAAIYGRGEASLTRALAPASIR